jgi:hypothetical protein
VRDPHWIAVAWVADVCERPLCLGGDQPAWRGGLGGAGGPQVEFAEPDLQQQWLVGRPSAIVTKLGLNGPTPDPQNSAYPTIFEDDFCIRMTDMRARRCAACSGVIVKLNG